jgi:hypothetical protein
MAVDGFYLLEMGSGVERGFENMSYIWKRVFLG